jgi:hypothetical protein
MIPLNYYQYRLDLNKANEDTAGPLIWDNVFNFLEEYGAKSMRPEDLDGCNILCIKDVAERVLTDVKLTKKFYRNYHSGNWKEED